MMEVSSFPKENDGGFISAVDQYESSDLLLKGLDFSVEINNPGEFHKF